MNEDGTLPRPRLEDAAGSVTVPESLRRAWDGAVPEPRAGQVWRAEWEGTAQLVVLLSSTDGHIAAPISLDPHYSDAASVVVDASDSPFAVPTTVWAKLRTPIPTAVLDRYIGSFPEPVLDTLARPKAESLTAEAQSISAADPINVYRGLLEDTIGVLANAEWLHKGTGSLTEVLRLFPVESIAQELGTTPQRALRIWRGHAALTLSEAEMLSPLTGLLPQDLVSRNPTPPAALIACIERPSRRSSLRKFASQRQLTDTFAHQVAAYETWALAARQTGDQSVTDWDGRLDVYFAAVLLDE